MQEITPISFLRFCDILSGATTIGDARKQYGDYVKLLENSSFVEFLQSGTSFTEVVFCFRAHKQFNAPVTTTRFIYRNHVKN